MKVWVRTRNDSSMGMDLPHSPNFAQAVYGFRELGAEIVPYHGLDAVWDSITKEDIVLDYIDQCNAVFAKFGATPHIPDYPECLSGFLGRKVWTDTINSISMHEEKWSAGWFVKPRKDKAFTGKTISSIHDLMGCGNHAEDYEALCSEPLDILAEWRVFLYHGQILDVRPYGLLLGTGRESWKYHYDAGVLEEMVSAFRGWKDHPAACSMDICVDGKGRTLLVEMNDAYALGCYGLPGILYAKLISARWSELLGREDVFDFH
jgi:hypothetical protein